MSDHSRYSAYRRKDNRIGIMRPDGVTPATNGEVIPNCFKENHEGEEQPYWNVHTDVVGRHLERLNKEDILS
jgi:hypothetical protein